MSDPWDVLSTTFDTTKNESDIPSHVADNILIAWPLILDFIKKYAPMEENIRVLEYGCGSGGFAYKLHTFDYQVTGVDSSKEMIKKATVAYGDQVDFLLGDSTVLSKLKHFSIITSIMALQFIENIEETLQDLANILEQDGLLIFAVHNPAQIKEYLQKGILFEEFDSVENPKKGILHLGKNKIPIFIRTAQEYTQLLQPIGFEQLLEAYPPFTKEFSEKYPIVDPTSEPEYLILGYRKTVSS
ncbi:MAG TPA: class I SAM-dependent methyltransferase [Candidatus Sulfotelmatobacter sp.]|jgi:2-polyprenyl-3-methyl-5-hydroxy-6-metoxy-1,4-benzoquinol methylase|nr:class I SAM-dependent methyltransferase [Candidatus Sulfotelmatobacter sp.]